MSSGDRWGAGSIVTSEAVVLDFNLAGLGSRSISRSLDTIVQFIAFLVFALVGALGSIGDGAAGIVIFLLGAFLAMFGYPVLMETLNNGRTLGKMAAGVRVVTVEGAPVRFRHALLRALIAIFDVLLSFGGIAVVSALLSRRGQRLGDMAAGTMVIRDRTAARDARAQTFPPPIGLEAFTQTIDARALTPASYLAVRNFLARAYDMHEPARSRMAADLAQLVHFEVRSPPAPPTTSPSLYLACVAAAAQRGQQLNSPRTSPPPPAATTALNLPSGPPARFVPPPPGTHPPARPVSAAPQVAPTPDRPLPAQPAADPPLPAQPARPAEPPPDNDGFAAPG